MYQSEIEEYYYEAKKYRLKKEEAIKNNEYKKSIEYDILYSDFFVKFIKKLEGLIGYNCREWFPGFKQSMTLYLDLRANIVVWILNQLDREHFESVLHKFVNSKNPFLSYLSGDKGQIRGELTKFFNKFNRERKHQNYDTCSNVCSMDNAENKIDSFSNYEVFKEIILTIIKEYSLIMDAETIILCLMNKSLQYIYDNSEILELQLVAWVLSKKYLGLPRY